MTAVRITKRIVDPITFEEFVGVEFIPHGLEDTVMDDQLSASMCFAAPLQPIHHPPPPPPPPPSCPPPPPTDDGTPSSPTKSFRPPTPPKSRGSGPDDPNAPRTVEELLMSPSGRRSSLLSPKGARGSLLSPKGLRKSLTSPRSNSPLGASGRSSRKLSSALKEIGEEAELDNVDLEGSLSNLSDQLQTSLSKITPVIKSVRFEDEVEMNEISRAHLSMMDDLFYASEDLANFRYEAFMEEAGLDINDFD